MSQQTQNKTCFGCSPGLGMETSFSMGANRVRFYWICSYRTHFSSLVIILPRKDLIASVIFNNRQRTTFWLRWRPVRLWGIHWPSLEIFHSWWRYFMIEIWIVLFSYLLYSLLGIFPSYSLQKLNIDRTCSSDSWKSSGENFLD